MGLFICAQCGVILRQRVRACRDCGNPISRHSPTLMPVLLAGRTTTNSPQALKPEHDTLLVERVVTRCKFNEAMQVKPRRFHGSTAFLTQNDPEEGDGDSSHSSESSNGGDKSGIETKAEIPSSNMKAEMLSVGTELSAPSAQTNADASNAAPGASIETKAQMLLVGTESNASSASTISTSVPVPSEPTRQSDGSRIGASIFGDDVEEKAQSTQQQNPDPVPVLGRLSDPANEDFFADTIIAQPQTSVDSQPVATSQPSPAISEQKSESAESEDSTSMDNTKLLRNAPLPSFMVADWLLLVVQETDGKTLSVSHTIEGTELPLVFGLLQGSTDPSLCYVQSQPDHAVSLSGSAAFLDADAKLQVSAAPDQSVNIDSRLAFEDGLGRVAALRLQGALSKSGVIGFEDSESREEFRRKFTRKPNLQEKEDKAVEKAAETTVEEKPPETKPPKDSKSQKGRKGADKGETITSAPVNSAKKNNPLAMIAAAIGIIGVVALLGFILISKFAPVTDSAQSPDDIPLRWHMRLMISEPYQAIFQEFDVNVTSDSGSNVSGSGTDQLGAYTMSGQIVDGAKLSLQKQYDQGYEWPIMFSGRMEKGQNGSFATGTFVWRRTSDRIEGTWEAVKLQSGWLPSEESLDQLHSSSGRSEIAPAYSNRLSAASES